MKKIYYILLMVGLISVGMSTKAEPASAAVSNWQKGASIEPRWDTDFSSDTFKQSVTNLSKTGANYVTLIIPYYQSNLYSTDIQKGWNTPTDASLAAAVQYAHSLGMKVMFKIHINSNDGQWRANINPGDRNTWYGNYNNILTHYAQIAQQNNVESYCIGTELIAMAAQDQNYDNTQRWRAMIANVRQLYSGKLTYSANWGPPNNGFVDEKNHIQFWDALDFIGMSAYYEMYTDNSVQSLVNAWSGYNTSDIQPLAQKWNKPIVFTEIGFKSVPYSFNKPWDFNFGGGFDETTQANAYEALFSYWSSQSFMQGVHLWFWSSDPNYGGQGNTDYTPQNKKAQSVMTNWFSGGGTPSSGNTAPPPAQTVSCPGPATGSFTGCYYNGTNLTSPVFTRTDSSINFDWGTGSPSFTVPVDQFSARWQGNFSFQAGSYTFTATADDGIRVLVDGNSVIDKWINQPATTYNATTNISSGTHLVTVEYYENGGNAVAKISWGQNTSGSTPQPQQQASCPAPATNAFTGCYYTDQNMSALGLSRTDNSINFDWGGGSPDPAIPVDHFSAVWQGNFNFNTGNYTFTATADDGIRVYVDGNLVIDKWLDQPATTYNATANLSAGTHLVKVEYYENGGNAVAKVSWSASNGTPPPSNPPPSIPPPATLPPSNIVYKNSYPTINGNYIDCYGNVDNDPAHHTTDPADTDPAHRIGQFCPANSLVGQNPPS